MFYCRSFGQSPMMKKGRFVLEENMQIPVNINTGTYLASFFLVDSNKKGYVDVPNALMIEAEGTATDTGLMVRYSGGKGLLHI